MFLCRSIVYTRILFWRGSRNEDLPTQMRGGRRAMARIDPGMTEALRQSDRARHAWRTACPPLRWTCKSPAKHWSCPPKAPNRREGRFRAPALAVKPQVRRHFAVEPCLTTRTALVINWTSERCLNHDASSPMTSDAGSREYLPRPDRPHASAIGDVPRKPRP